MVNYTNRRSWLKQTALAMAGLGLAGFDRPVPVGQPAAAIVLANNENPYGPSPAARRAIVENYLQSNRYPDDAILVLRKAVADHWQLAAENIVLVQVPQKSSGWHASWRQKKKDMLSLQIRLTKNGTGRPLLLDWALKKIICPGLVSRFWTRYMAR